MDHFLTCKQCAKEVEVEEVHIEENLETLTTNSSSTRNGKMGTCGCQQRMERCFVLTAKRFIKQAETNSSQAVS